jgi:hypothetical protein
VSAASRHGNAVCAGILAVAPRATCNSARSPATEETIMSLATILLILLFLVLLGALPSWPYSRSWGYYPSGFLGVVVVVVVILLLAGRI